MSITIKFPSKPSEEEVKKFDKAVEKFSGIAHNTVYQVENLIRKAKTPIQILACKYISQYRHGETMKLIRKKEREIKKKQKETKKCRVCGCTDNKACNGGCCWVEDDLCSQCKT